MRQILKASDKKSVKSTVRVSIRQNRKESIQPGKQMKAREKNRKIIDAAVYILKWKQLRKTQNADLAAKYMKLSKKTLDDYQTQFKIGIRYQLNILNAIQNNERMSYLRQFVKDKKDEYDEFKNLTPEQKQDETNQMYNIIEKCITSYLTPEQEKMILQQSNQDEGEDKDYSEKFQGFVDSQKQKQICQNNNQSGLEAQKNQNQKLQNQLNSMNVKIQPQVFDPCYSPISKAITQCTEGEYTNTLSTHQSNSQADFDSNQYYESEQFQQNNYNTCESKNNMISQQQIDNFNQPILQNQIEQRVEFQPQEYDYNLGLQQQTQYINKLNQYQYTNQESETSFKQTNSNSSQNQSFQSGVILDNYYFQDENIQNQNFLNEQQQEIHYFKNYDTQPQYNIHYIDNQNNYQFLQQYHETNNNDIQQNQNTYINNQKNQYFSNNYNNLDFQQNYENDFNNQGYLTQQSFNDYQNI
ncbi:hypothetical protein PPERSA_04660 [Pseudocohnilembus persalinus]|uniref:Uncharacterized protein n=1 Tax=Pseudocohnilembus persalinus TaxID=266149 RepID=A0A0V0R4N3_PSEPJ|nr:hypothetical protein PPERSA_04660 [Pseudocohnilembus persalinus]|eukprot:KRX09354.1 hypothetical protein PPERSA_04660 [Pseudocohnilembus persalinus]